MSCTVISAIISRPVGTAVFLIGVPVRIEEDEDALDDVDGKPDVLVETVDDVMVLEVDDTTPEDVFDEYEAPVDLDEDVDSDNVESEIPSFEEVTSE